MSRTTIVRMAVLLVSMIAILGAALPVSAQEGQGFTETFDSPQLTGWEHGPEVLVQNGALHIGPAQFASRLGIWQDFELSLRWQFSGEGETHVNYRATDQGGYLLVLGGEGVRLMKRMGQGEPQELAAVQGTAFPEDDWIDLAISLAGGEHTISANGSTLLAASDPDPLRAGGIVFASMGQRTTQLDDVTLTVQAAQEGAPPAAPVEPAAATAAPAAVQDGSASWQDLLKSLSSSEGSTFEADVFVVNLLLAVLASFILSRVYVYWGGALSNRRKFAANFMLVTITTTFIILVVRSSVALSLGLVGALSIIRFRAAIKDPEELAYLFFAISLGIGLGDNQRLVTLVTLGMVIAIIGLARLFRQTQADVNLHLSITSRGPEKVSLPQVMDALAKHVEKLRLLRYDESSDTLELSFVVEFRHIADLNRARAALLNLSPALQVSFLDNKGIW